MSQCQSTTVQGPAPLSGFTLSRPYGQPRLALADPPRPTASPAERHRPGRLADMVGQGPIVWRLQEFLDAPYSAALLFEGETGTGKTTAALCLAAELGAVEFGGLDRIKSGMQDAQAVEDALSRLRYTPMLGSGWKVVIVDEVDWMSPKAAQLWLSALEDLPPRSVIVFTTNHPGKFQPRFLDRCDRFQFEARARLLAQDAEALIGRVWASDRRIGPPPRLADLPGAVDDLGHLSFRRVVQAVPAYRTKGPSRPTTGRMAAALTNPSEVAERRRQAAYKAAATRKARKEVACG